MASVTERITELEAELARLKAVAASNSEDGAIRVAVHGAGGRLGSLITKQLTSGGDSKASFAGSVGRDAVIPENTNVIVDVTLPVGTKALLRKLIAQQCSRTTPARNRCLHVRARGLPD